MYCVLCVLWIRINTVVVCMGVLYGCVRSLYESPMCDVEVRAHCDDPVIMIAANKAVHSLTYPSPPLTHYHHTPSDMFITIASLSRIWMSGER